MTLKEPATKLERIRNIGVMAHIDAGKTTLTERILHFTGYTHRIGEVDDGTTVMDWMDQERERGITITSAAITCHYKDHQINVIDTPGHVDFTAEVERSLRVLDGAIAIFCAVGGVQPQSETVWMQADRYRIPRIVFINKNDRVGSDFFNVIKSIEDRLHANPLPVQIPIGSESSFEGVIDLIAMRALIWKDHESLLYEETDIPESVRADALLWREKMIDKLTEKDDRLLERYIEGADLTVQEIKQAVRKQTLNLDVFPVFAGAALRNMGVQSIIEGILDYLPSPLDIPPVVGHRVQTGEPVMRLPSSKEPLTALVFKIMNDPERRKLYYLRVYSGRLEPPYRVINPRTMEEERIGRLFRVFSNKRERVDIVNTGDIAAVIGLKTTVTGDTLCDQSDPVYLERMQFPTPVVFVAIEPRTVSDQQKMAAALESLAEEDPTFRVHLDPDTGQTIISGMGELHLEVLTVRLQREFKVEAKVGKPQVAYRESIRGSAQHEEKFIKTLGGINHYAHVVIRVNSVPRSAGFHFKSQVTTEMVPDAFVEDVKTGIQDSLSAGIQLGYPIEDVEAVLAGGSYNPDLSTSQDFQYAASVAFREACMKANPVLLSPFMSVEITLPNEFLGDVIGNLQMRNATIEGIDTHKQFQIVRALVPLSQMFGYATDLRSLTQGRATYTMKLSHFDVEEKR